MKKLLFVIENFKVGGIQKSLVNLLNDISDLYDIDIAAFDCEGDYLDLVPSNVHIIKLPQYYSIFARPLNSLKSNALFYGIKVCYGLIVSVFVK